METLVQKLDPKIQIKIDEEYQGIDSSRGGVFLNLEGNQYPLIEKRGMAWVVVDGYYYDLVEPLREKAKKDISSEEEFISKLVSLLESEFDEYFFQRFKFHQANLDQEYQRLNKIVTQYEGRRMEDFLGDSSFQRNPDSISSKIRNILLDDIKSTRDEANELRSKFNDLMERSDQIVNTYDKFNRMVKVFNLLIDKINRNKKATQEVKNIVLTNLNLVNQIRYEDMDRVSLVKINGGEAQVSLIKSLLTREYSLEEFIDLIS